jgi:hypothetical protein
MMRIGIGSSHFRIKEERIHRATHRARERGFQRKEEKIHGVTQPAGQRKLVRSVIYIYEKQQEFIDQVKREKK